MSIRDEYKENHAITGTGFRRSEQDIVVSESTQDILSGFHAVVRRAAVAEDDKVTVKSVTSMKREIAGIASSTAVDESKRLGSN